MKNDLIFIYRKTKQLTIFAYKNKINLEIDKAFIWGSQMLAGFMTVTETAQKWNLNRRTIQIMCRKGRIEGAAKFGKYWAIPIDAERPLDHRITSGQYINWRDKAINGSDKVLADNTSSQTGKGT